MKVLLAVCDLYQSAADTALLYRRLIERNPHLDFYYLRKKESEELRLPANAHPLPFRPAPLHAEPDDLLLDLDLPAWLWQSFLQAADIAHSVQGLQFDVLDWPDSQPTGVFLKPACEYFGVAVSRMVLFLAHSRFSVLREDWQAETWSDIPLGLLEQWSARCADIRYSLSDLRAAEQSSGLGLPVHVFDPLRIVTPMPRLADTDGEAPPNLYFFGRPEKGRGTDTFLALVEALPRELYAQAFLCGADYQLQDGGSAQAFLARTIAERDLPVSIRKLPLPAELRQILEAKSLLFFPGREDIQHLTALDALFSGCPVVLGAGSSVAGLLRRRFPETPFLEVGSENPAAALPNLEALLREYTEYRSTLVEFLPQRSVAAEGPALEAIYRQPEHSDTLLRGELRKWFRRVFSRYGGYEPAERRGLRTFAVRLSERVEQTLNAPRDSGGMSLRGIYCHLRQQPENTHEALDRKVELCSHISNIIKVDRIRIWNELSRLERMRGNLTTAAGYKLRTLRFLGRDRFGDLPLLCRLLEHGGFPLEAQAARALFGRDDAADRSVESLLASALHVHCRHQPQMSGVTDDRRTILQPRVSLIVATGDTAEKLEFFFRRAVLQTLVESGQLELILVDSEPSTERLEAFRACAARFNISAMYAAGGKAESMSAAWNRGIFFARAPYLALLELHHALEPQCLERFAAELDADDSLDWIVSSHVVAAVDREGKHLRDLALHRRSDFEWPAVYLDRDMMNAPGALYRRSLHERFGYFDPTLFRKGRIEFHNRIRPWIRLKAIDETLAADFRFPESAQPVGPADELEELRAVLLHRSIPGMRFGLRTRSNEECRLLLRRCFAIQNEDSSRPRSDIDCAAAVMRCAAHREAEPAFLKASAAVYKLQEEFRALDYLPSLAALEANLQVAMLERAVSQTLSQLEPVPAVAEDAFDIFADARYLPVLRPWDGRRSAELVDDVCRWV
jgi:hypothetical protein